MFASFVALAVLAPSAFAAVSMTAPVASSSWPAGQQQTITWIDDGQTPTLSSFGNSSVGIYAGNQIQQTLLQLIVPSVDVSTTSSIAFTPDPSIGPDSSAYFIRFTSLGLTSGIYPAEAFSAKFTLTGMSGTFNTTVQAQIDAASSASSAASSTPASGSSSAASSPTGSTSTSASPSSAASGSASHSAASSSKSASATGTTTNGAAGLVASAGVVGTVVALTGAMLL